jgi:predicted transcriptional regulator
MPAAFDVRAAARELLGADWQVPLATMLGVNIRTVQRWANGQNACPEPIAARIGELLAIARRSRTDAAADRARRAAEHDAADTPIKPHGPLIYRLKKGG